MPSKREVQHFLYWAKKYDAVIIVTPPKWSFPNPYLRSSGISIEKNVGTVHLPAQARRKEIIPAIFHPIRALQLQLIYYSLSEHWILIGNSNRLEHFNNPVPVERPAKRGRGGKSNKQDSGSFCLPAFFILFIIGLITVIVPIAQKTVLNLTPHPFATVSHSFLDAGTFRAIDTTRAGKTALLYRPTAMQTTFSDAGLRLSADR